MLFTALVRYEPHPLPCKSDGTADATLISTILYVYTATTAIYMHVPNTKIQLAMASETKLLYCSRARSDTKGSIARLGRRPGPPRTLAALAHPGVW